MNARNLSWIRYPLLRYFTNMSYKVMKRNTSITFTYLLWNCWILLLKIVQLYYLKIFKKIYTIMCHFFKKIITWHIQCGGRWGDDRCLYMEMGILWKLVIYKCLIRDKNFSKNFKTLKISVHRVQRMMSYSIKDNYNNRSLY